MFGSLFVYVYCLMALSLSTEFFNGEGCCVTEFFGEPWRQGVPSVNECKAFDNILLRQEVARLGSTNMPLENLLKDTNIMNNKRGNTYT